MASALLPVTDEPDCIVKTLLAPAPMLTLPTIVPALTKVLPAWALGACIAIRPTIEPLLMIWAAAAVRCDDGRVLASPENVVYDFGLYGAARLVRDLGDAGRVVACRQRQARQVGKQRA